eukprot:531553-Hanusia_phi.AAC.1
MPRVTVTESVTVTLSLRRSQSLSVNHHSIQLVVVVSSECKSSFITVSLENLYAATVVPVSVTTFSTSCQVEAGPGPIARDRR